MAFLAGLAGASLLVSGLLAGPSFGATGPGAPAPAPDAAPAVAGTTTGPTGPTGAGGPAARPLAALSSPTDSSDCFGGGDPGPQPPRPSDAPGGTFALYDFEDGTTQGWSGSGEAQTTVTGAAAAGGSKSLLVTGLTSTSGAGVTVSGLGVPGWFRVTAQVRLTAGAAPTIVALRPKATSAVAGSAWVSASSWTAITAFFRAPVLYADWYCNGTLTGAQFAGPVDLGLVADPALCAEVADVPTTVHLDDVTITGAAGGTPVPNFTPTALPTPTCTPSVPPAPACVAKYTVTGRWPGGYSALVEVRNTSARALKGWALSWTYEGDEKVTALWGGSYTQAGATVTVTSPPAATVPPLGRISVGLVGTHRAPLSPHSPQVTLDGTACRTSS